MNDDLISLFAYNRWADDRVLGACRKLTPEQYTAEPVPGWSSVRASVVHVAAASVTWLRRLKGEPDDPGLTESDLPTIDDVEARSRQSHEEFLGLIATAPPGWLAEPRTFTTRTGRSAILPRWVVLRHVVNHATYHRGQVASKLKRLGVDPPATDLFFWGLEQSPQP